MYAYIRHVHVPSQATCTIHPCIHTHARTCSRMASVGTRIGECCGIRVWGAWRLRTTIRLECLIRIPDVVCVSRNLLKA